MDIVGGAFVGAVRGFWGLLADFTNSSELVPPSQIRWTSTSPVSEWRLLTNLRIRAGCRNLRVANVSSTDFGNRVDVKTSRANAHKLSILLLAHLVQRSITSIMVAWVARSFVVGILVVLMWAGDTLDCRSKTGIQVFESRHMESAVFGTGDLFKFSI